MAWETVIGLEVHVQLACDSKIFSGSATAYGAEPNTQASAIDLGLPGVLPVLNKRAVEMAVKLGVAIDAQINRRSIFARKNYFYPDSPKGYQISQYERPIVGQGSLDIEVNGVQKRIGITRAHLEEDAGKSLHENFHQASGIDLNRAGTPLLEVVSEPDMRSAAEAVAYVKALHELVRYLGVCDGNMQEGSFRCDVNVSVRPVGQTEFGTRTECKNLNSFRFIEKAIDYEVNRQIAVLESGGKVVQETRLYDPDKDETRSMRGKEDAHDYRYFPDPDLLPVNVDEAMLQKMKDGLPELPRQKRERFVIEYALSHDDVLLLSADADIADFFESVARESTRAKLAANWIVSEVLPRLAKEDAEMKQCQLPAAQLALLIRRIDDGTISHRGAKTVFAEIWTGNADVDQVIADQGLKQMSDSGALEKIIDEVVQSNPQQVEQYRAGKEKVFGFFVGQVMKATQGKANPAQINHLLKAKLS